MTTPIPEEGYPSNTGRTVADMQTYTETMLSIAKEVTGGAGEAASVQLSGNSFTPINNACVYVIDTNGMGPTDTLNNINPEIVRDGMVVTVRITDDSRVITIVNSSGGLGQILTQDGNNIVLDDKRIFVPLKYNAAISAFEELNRTSVLGGGGGGVLNNFYATAYPQNTDDITEGYRAGSLWYYPDFNWLAICIDPTEGEAQWEYLAVLPQNVPIASDIFTNGVAIQLLVRNSFCKFNSEK